MADRPRGGCQAGEGRRFQMLSIGRAVDGLSKRSREDPRVKDVPGVTFPGRGRQSPVQSDERSECIRSRARFLVPCVISLDVRRHRAACVEVRKLPIARISGSLTGVRRRTFPFKIERSVSTSRSPPIRASRGNNVVYVSRSSIGCQWSVNSCFLLENRHPHYPFLHGPELPLIHHLAPAHRKALHTNARLGISPRDGPLNRCRTAVLRESGRMDVQSGFWPGKVGL